MEPIKFNYQDDQIAVNRLNNGKWTWQLVFINDEDCYYNDDQYDTPGQAADAAWAFILEQESK
jgi:hypothetical protein